MSSAAEHRWRDITGPSVADDPDWRGRGVPSPTFGDGTPASLSLGEIRPLGRPGTAVNIWFEVYDGQGDGDDPTAPTPVTTATCEVLTLTKDQNGSEIWSVGPLVVALTNQKKSIALDLPAQGLSFVRLSSLGGTLPDPGSIRVFSSEAFVLS